MVLCVRDVKLFQETFPSCPCVMEHLVIHSFHSLSYDGSIASCRAIWKRPRTWPVKHNLFTWHLQIIFSLTGVACPLQTSLCVCEKLDNICNHLKCVNKHFTNTMVWSQKKDLHGHLAMYATIGGNKYCVGPQRHRGGNKINLYMFRAYL